MLHIAYDTLRIIGIYTISYIFPQRYTLCKVLFPSFLLTTTPRESTMLILIFSIKKLRIGEVKSHAQGHRLLSIENCVEVERV